MLRVRTPAFAGASYVWLGGALGGEFGAPKLLRFAKGDPGGLPTPPRYGTIVGPPMVMRLLGVRPDASLERGTFSVSPARFCIEARMLVRRGVLACGSKGGKMW